MNVTEINHGMQAIDVNNKPLGSIDHIITDSWSGEPRKFVIRMEDDVSALYFAPDNVAEISGEQVKLNIAVEEMEKT